MPKYIIVVRPRERENAYVICLVGLNLMISFSGDSTLTQLAHCGFHYYPKHVFSLLFSYSINTLTNFRIIVGQDVAF